MFETIVIATAELVGAASGATWTATWSFAAQQHQLVGSIIVSSQKQANVHFELDAPGPWLHSQSVYGGFDFKLKLPSGGGAMNHIPNEPVWVLNGNNWLVPPLSMGSSGAGTLDFSWYAPVKKFVPAGSLNVEANWQQTANMVVRLDSKNSTKTWDLNGDGSVGGADLLIMLQSWNQPWAMPDLLALLSKWTG